jgi:hypothetical protein
MPVINGVYLKDFTALPGAVADADIIPIAITGDNVAYRTTVAGIVTDARITAKLLTGLSVTGGAVIAADTILEALGKVQNQINGKQGTVTLTTTGTSGASTLIANTLNIPQYQGTGNYITSLTGEATASGPGAAAVTLTNSAVIGKVLTGLNVTGGTVLAADSILDGFGKVQNQINGLIGGSIFQGTWNASTNTPTLVSSVGTNGYYYIVSVAGSTNLDGITDWKVGDWAIFAGAAWEKVDNTDSVSSVNGFTGAVSLTTDDISEGASNLYYTDARARASVSLTTTGTSGASTYDSGTGVFNIPTYADAYVGTVTSVAALTLGTTGTDLSSTVANGTTTPVITLQVPTASASNRGALSSADWSTFNSKQSTITLTTTGTSGAATLVGSTLNVPNYADGGVLSLSAIGGTANANAATITGTVLNLQPADASFGGVVTTGTQTFAGTKTLTGDLFISKSAPSIQLKAANSSVAGFILANASGTHHWSLNTDAGGAGQQGEFRIANSILGNNAIKIETNNAVTLTGGLTGTTANFTGQLTLGSTITNGTYTYTLPSATGTLALTSAIPANPVGGTGTTNYLPKFTGASTIGDSAIQTDATGNLMVGSANSGNAGSINVSVGVAGTTSGGLQLWAATNQTHYIQFGDATTGASPYTGYVGYAHSNDSLLFGTNGADKMTLNASGNLSIGNTNDTYKLDVNGTVNLSGALSGTSATFSGNIVSTVGNNGALLSATTATTGYQYIDIITTSGRTQLIQESSVAGTTVTNSTAYASMFGSAVAKDVILFTNGANRLKLDGSTGAATFSSTINSSTVTSSGNIISSSGTIASLNGGDMQVYTSGNANYFSLTSPTNGNFLVKVNQGVGAINALNILNTGAATFSSSIAATSATFSGAVSKGSGSFRIEHPLPSLSETHQLVHSFIEGPQADLIYRGRLILVNGKAQANIDEVSTMTEGTFEVLCREVQCFTTNESGWDLIKGKVIGNIIYIESQNESSTDEISWMVIGERKDKHMMDTEWTDEDGKVIVEPLKPIEPEPIEEVEPIAPIEPTDNLE